jgi:twitching motility protein PilT
VKRASRSCSARDPETLDLFLTETRGKPEAATRAAVLAFFEIGISGVEARLVFGTLHTNNAAKTMDRIISVFPSGEQEGIRNVLGETIRAVVAQQLLPKVGGGRVAALEILFANPAVGNMIREGKTGQITSTIQTGVKEGMIDMDSSIRKLFDEKKITARAAYDKAIDKEAFKNLV